MAKRVLTAADIIPPSEYAKARKDLRTKVSVKKRNRRFEVGPHITFYFECYETMWLQVQEMLYIEKGGAEQVPGELEAYNPLIPNGSELTATFMIEIDDPIRRKRILDGLGGIEETAFLRVGGETIMGMPEAAPPPRARRQPCSSCIFRSPSTRSPPSPRRTPRWYWASITRTTAT
jgi:hypothetical protein